MKLPKFRFGWKQLDACINWVVDAVNQNDVQSSADITVDRTSSGVFLKLVQKGSPSSSSAPTPSTSTADQPWLTTPSGETAGWHTVDVIDAACVKKTMFVWGGSPA